MSRIKRVAILAVLAIGAYVLMSSIYTVSEVEQAIITQFGWEETRHPWVFLPPDAPPKRLAKQG
jgi:hypothetical protein